MPGRNFTLGGQNKAKAVWDRRGNKTRSCKLVRDLSIVNQTDDEDDPNEFIPAQDGMQAYITSGITSMVTVKFNTQAGDYSTTTRPLVSFYGYPLSNLGVKPEPDSGDKIIFDDDPTVSYVLKEQKSVDPAYAWYEFYAVEESNTISGPLPASNVAIPTTLTLDDVTQVVQAEIAKIPPPPNYTTIQTLIFPVADTVLPPTGLNNVVAQIDPNNSNRILYTGTSTQLFDSGFVVPEQGEHLYEIVFGYTSTSLEGTTSRPGLLVTASQLRAALAVQPYSPLANPQTYPNTINRIAGTPTYSPQGSYFRGGREFGGGSGGTYASYAMGVGRELLLTKPSQGSTAGVTLQVYEWTNVPIINP